MSAATIPWRLDRATEAGLRWVAAAEIEALFKAGRAKGLACARAEIGSCRDKEGLLERLATALAFPSWFGHNWDALADCLADLSWRPGAGHLLVLDDCRLFRAAAPGDYAVLLEILADASDAWRAREIPFWAFISMAAAPGRQT